MPVGVSSNAGNNRTARSWASCNNCPSYHDGRTSPNGCSSSSMSKWAERRAPIILETIENKVLVHRQAWKQRTPEKLWAKGKSHKKASVKNGCLQESCYGHQWFAIWVIFFFVQFSEKLDDVTGFLYDTWCSETQRKSPEIQKLSINQWTIKSNFKMLKIHLKLVINLRLK